MVRKRFTKEFVEACVSEVVSGKPQVEVAAKYGISPKTLSRWYLVHRSKRTPEQITEAAELKRLRKENKRLQAENEFLKKAASYVAKQD